MAVVGSLALVGMALIGVHNEGKGHKYSGNEVETKIEHTEEEQ